MAGVGKTTLAVEIGYQCLPGPNVQIDPPFDYVVWVSAAKPRLEEKPWFDEVLDEIARRLDCRYITNLSLKEKQQELDELLRLHRVLLILDNYETMEDSMLENWIEDIPEPGKVLITSRHMLRRATWPFHLGGLAEDEALELIRRHVERLSLHGKEFTEEMPDDE